nr:hypothetical protein [Desulfuromonadales bacterium]
MSIFVPFKPGKQDRRRISNSFKKCVSHLCRSNLILFPSFILVSLYPSFGNCAELRPYELPSQKRAPYQQPYPNRYEAPLQNQPVKDFDYVSFGARAETLSEPERQKLIEKLEKRLIAAHKKRNAREVSHYGKLLEIVNEIR